MPNFVPVLFGVLTAAPLAEEPPEALEPFAWGLSPSLIVIIFLAIVVILWLALRGLGLDDLGKAIDGHGHDDHGHEEETSPAEAEPQEEEEEEEETDEIAGEEIAASPPSEPDDLRRIEGIGPKVQSVLNNAGISTFADLAATDTENLQAILDAAEYQYMNPASWPNQAALAAAGDWEGLDKLQDELKGGK